MIVNDVTQWPWIVTALALESVLMEAVDDSISSEDRRVSAEDRFLVVVLGNIFDEPTGVNVDEKYK